MSTSDSKSLDIPDLKVEKYITKFGPHQDDVIVIDLNYTPTPTMQTTWTLQDVVSKALPNFSENYLNDLLSLGSVYVTKYQTGSRSTVSGEQKSRRWHRRVKERFKRNHGFFAQDTPRITQRLMNSTESKNVILPQATLSLRFHITPQRFPITPYINWHSRVCYMNDDFVIVNKPGGIPSQPVASNYQECVYVQAGLSLFQAPLYPTSRLDLWSTGLLCLGRHPAAVKQVNEWHRNNSFQKTYRVLCYHNPLTSPLCLKSLSLPLTLENWMPKGKNDLSPFSSPK
jgi:23S rRNA-/tRNA-specific pseudouridylate synthase